METNVKKYLAVSGAFCALSTIKSVCVNRDKLNSEHLLSQDTQDSHLTSRLLDVDLSAKRRIRLQEPIT